MKLLASSVILIFLLSVSAFSSVNAFTTNFITKQQFHVYNNKLSSSSKLAENTGDWNGEVVPDDGGKIKGCKIATTDSITDWIVTIDGIEADLGKFSEAIYKKFMMDAKKQQFQGFRPGTVPPHVEPTYRAFTMDECARETVMEALSQNNIRPFESARNDIVIERVSIPPPVKKGKKKKKSKKQKKKGGNNAETSPVMEEPADVIEEEPPQWLDFDTMKEAITAGWQPGQSFSFVAKNVRGQKLEYVESDSVGPSPI